MKPRKPRIRDLPPEEQAGRWWSSAYVKNAAFDPEYLPALIKEAQKRGTPQLKALLVSLALQGKLKL